MISNFILQNTKRFFDRVIKIISGIFVPKFLFFRRVEGGFRDTPKRECTPPINLEVFFSDILATATRLNTLYGLETWYVQLPRRVLITKKVLRHIQHFWRIHDVINVGFLRHFAVFGYSKCHKVSRNSQFSHRIWILIGFTTLSSLKCNRLCVTELWRHIRRKSAISSTSLSKMTDFYFNMFYFSDHHEILPVGTL